MIKAILFDMDGVLFDSMPNHAYAWSHAMTQFGLAMTREEVYMHEGRTGSGTVNLLAQRFWGRDATEEEIRKIYAAKSALFAQLPKPKPICGADVVLSTVRELGYTIVLVTGSATDSLLNRLNESYPGIFTKEHMVTGYDVHYGKPHPEPYLIGLKKAGVNADEAIVVENAPLGIESGHAAGIFTIGVNTGPLPDDVLWKAGADKVLPDMNALNAFFLSLQG